MEDSKDTIFVTGIGEKVTGEEFISLFQKVGEIKTESKTAQRMAIMRYTETGTREAIVTYKDPSSAEKAVKQLNGPYLGSSGLHVLMAEQALRYNANVEAQHHHQDMYGEVNTAWKAWINAGRRSVINDGFPKGGQGGEGGGVWLFRGQDGQPGEDGPGGKGGEGGRGGCSVS